MRKVRNLPFLRAVSCQLTGAAHEHELILSHGRLTRGTIVHNQNGNCQKSNRFPHCIPNYKSPICNLLISILILVSPPMAPSTDSGPLDGSEPTPASASATTPTR